MIQLRTAMWVVMAGAACRESRTESSCIIRSWWDQLSTWVLCADQSMCFHLFLNLKIRLPDGTMKIWWQTRRSLARFQNHKLIWNWKNIWILDSRRQGRAMPATALFPECSVVCSLANSEMSSLLVLIDDMKKINIISTFESLSVWLLISHISNQE